MLLAIGFPSERLWSEREIYHGLMTNVSWRSSRSKENIECVVIVVRRLIGRSIWWLVVMPNMCMWKLDEHSISGAEYS